MKNGGHVTKSTERALRGSAQAETAANDPSSDIVSMVGRSHRREGLR